MEYIIRTHNAQSTRIWKPLHPTWRSVAISKSNLNYHIKPFRNEANINYCLHTWNFTPLHDVWRFLCWLNSTLRFQGWLNPPFKMLTPNKTKRPAQLVFSCWKHPPIVPPPRSRHYIVLVIRVVTLRSFLLFFVCQGAWLQSCIIEGTARRGQIMPRLPRTVFLFGASGQLCANGLEGMSLGAFEEQPNPTRSNPNRSYVY